MTNKLYTGKPTNTPKYDVYLCYDYKTLISYINFCNKYNYEIISMTQDKGTYTILYKH